MTRKSIIALFAVIALFAGTVQAHPPWDLQYAWKAAGSVDVQMYVVRWAEIYGQENGILITQQDNGDFIGCTCLQVCVNFNFLRINAKFEAAQLVTSGTSPSGVGFKATANAGWYVSLSSPYAGTSPTTTILNVGGHNAPSNDTAFDGTNCATFLSSVYEKDETSIVLANNSVAVGSNLPLALCVKAVDIDPQSQVYTVGMKIPVGTVILTMMPDVEVDGWTYDP